MPQLCAFNLTIYVQCLPRRTCHLNFLMQGEGACPHMLPSPLTDCQHLLLLCCGKTRNTTARNNFRRLTSYLRCKLFFCRCLNCPTFLYFYIEYIAFYCNFALLFASDTSEIKKTPCMTPQLLIRRKSDICMSELVFF